LVTLARQGNREEVLGGFLFKGEQFKGKPAGRVGQPSSFKEGSNFPNREKQEKSAAALLTERGGEKGRESSKLSLSYPLTEGRGGTGRAPTLSSQTKGRRGQEHRKGKSDYASACYR